MRTRLCATLAAAIAIASTAAHAATLPSLVCSGDATLECTSAEGVRSVVAATVQSAAGGPLLVIWSVNGRDIVTNGLPGGVSIPVTLTLTNSYRPGSNVVGVAVSEDGTNFAVCSATVVVQDTTAPVIHRIEATPSRLWPPNHRMVPVAVNVRVGDACGPVRTRIISITSNEPVNGRGDGNTAPDWAITGPLRAMLRAERSGRGGGRIYTITVEAADAAGNRTQGVTHVTVPHDQGGRGANARSSRR